MKSLDCNPTNPTIKEGQSNSKASKFAPYASNPRCWLFKYVFVLCLYFEGVAISCSHSHGNANYSRNFGFWNWQLFAAFAPSTLLLSNHRSYFQYSIHEMSKLPFKLSSSPPTPHPPSFFFFSTKTISFVLTISF